MRSWDVPTASLLFKGCFRIDIDIYGRIYEGFLISSFFTKEVIRGKIKQIMCLH